MANKKAKLTLKVETRSAEKRPVIHILMPDGRVTEFKERAIVLLHPEHDDDGVQALLINGKGEPYYTPDGKLAVVPVPAFGLETVPDPALLLSWKEMAKRAGVSLSSAKRMSTAGELPRPRKLGKRKVGFRQGDVDAAVAKFR